MNAFFVAPAGLTLKQAASSCNFKGFEWKQQVTQLPCPSLFYTDDPHGTLSVANFCKDSPLPPKATHTQKGPLTATADFPFPDPPDGGYTFPDHLAEAQNFPFYYNETLVLNEEQSPTGFCISTTPCFPMVNPDGTVLHFWDAPGDICLPGGTGTGLGCAVAPGSSSFMGFTTSLVGIDLSDQPSSPLYQWTWTDTYNGTTGGIPALSYPLPAPPADPGGTGGITITSVNGVPQIPPSISCAASPNVLWPPDSKEISVNVTGTISAGTSAILAGSQTFSVADTEGQVQPSGPVTVAPDGTYSLNIALVASRDGSDKNGRQCSIAVVAADEIGNLGSCSAVVTVPHDQGH